MVRFRTMPAGSHGGGDAIDPHQTLVDA